MGIYKGVLIGLLALVLLSGAARADVPGYTSTNPSQFSISSFSAQYSNVYVGTSQYLSLSGSDLINGGGNPPYRATVYVVSVNNPSQVLASFNCYLSVNSDGTFSFTSCVYTTSQAELTNSPVEAFAVVTNSDGNGDFAVSGYSNQYSVVATTTLPTISGTSDVVATATGSAGAVVSWASPTATDAVGDALQVTCAPTSGSTFAIGATTVSCSATDNYGNTATATFTVTVNAGTTPPTFAGVPSDYVDSTPAASSSGSTETYTAPTATDQYGASVAVSCAPATGSTFAIGTTTVTCTATDAYSNTATATFTITVNAPQSSGGGGSVVSSGGGSPGGGGGGGGGSGSATTVTVYAGSNNETGYTINNFTTDGTETFAIGSKTFIVTLNFITPTSVGVTVNGNSYTIGNGATQLLNDPPDYAYYMNLMGISYLPIQQSADVLLYGVPQVPATTTIVPQNTSAQNASATLPTTTVQAAPTTTVAAKAAPVQQSVSQPIVSGAMLEIVAGVVVTAAVAAFLYSKRGAEQRSTR